MFSFLLATASLPWELLGLHSGCPQSSHVERVVLGAARSEVRPWECSCLVTRFLHQWVHRSVDYLEWGLDGGNNSLGADFEEIVCPNLPPLLFLFFSSSVPSPYSFFHLPLLFLSAIIYTTLLSHKLSTIMVPWAQKQQPSYLRMKPLQPWVEANIWKF